MFKVLDFQAQILQMVKFLLDEVVKFKILELQLTCTVSISLILCNVTSEILLQEVICPGLAHCYCPPTKLRGGNVFSRVCLSVVLSTWGSLTELGLNPAPLSVKSLGTPLPVQGPSSTQLPNVFKCVKRVRSRSRWLASDCNDFMLIVLVSFIAI